MNLNLLFGTVACAYLNISRLANLSVQLKLIVACQNKKRIG